VTGTRVAWSPFVIRWAAPVRARIGRTSRRPAKIITSAAISSTPSAVAAVRARPSPEKTLKLFFAPR
jgi:hypothetical protein